MSVCRLDPWLLTPGPLTTSMSVKQAMLHDWGSRDQEFIRINASVRTQLLDLANAAATHECVPVQGSGTFAVEATLATLVPRTGKVAVLVNGAYGKRVVQILDYIGRDHQILETPENVPCDPQALANLLTEDATVNHVVAVYCETTTGILNPIQAVAKVCAEHGRALIIDAMSAFGALPLDARETSFAAAVASSNKCLEGVPGMGFALIDREVLRACEGNSHSLSLDLYAQWLNMEKTSQWRFTPPTHVIVAFHQALQEHAEEGGVAGRGARYTANCEALTRGMRELGFDALLPAHLQAPIITTWLKPDDPAFDFEAFYRELSNRGYVIYPGKLTVADTFRIGCIGRLGDGVISGVLAAIDEVLRQMGVRNRAGKG